jgi:F-type H+-transporting ATPase subunit epsilon
VRITLAGSCEVQLILFAGGIPEVQAKLIKVLADSAIRGANLNKALEYVEDARAKAQDTRVFAAVDGELAMLAAQLAAVRKLRKK